jgi:hypothetical protein
MNDKPTPQVGEVWNIGGKDNVYILGVRGEAVWVTRHNSHPWTHFQTPGMTLIERDGKRGNDLYETLPLCQTPKGYQEACQAWWDDGKSLETLTADGSYEKLLSFNAKRMFSRCIRMVDEPREGCEPVTEEPNTSEPPYVHSQDNDYLVKCPNCLAMLTQRVPLL